MTGTGDFTKKGTGTSALDRHQQLHWRNDCDRGTLLVNGSIALSSLTTVESGAFLGGTGIVGATQIAAGGTLSPGNSIGTLRWSGDLGFASGSFYRVEVSPRNADRTDVTGTASLAGTVQAAFLPGTYLERNYTILSSTSRTDDVRGSDHRAPAGGLRCGAGL